MSQVKLVFVTIANLAFCYIKGYKKLLLRLEFSSKRENCFAKCIKSVYYKK